MILYVDNENKVRAVDSTTDTSLTPLYVDETADSFPFKGWSVAKICCYRVTVNNGIITMMTPYVDSRMLEMVDALGHQIDNSAPYKQAKVAYIGDTEAIFTDVPSGAVMVALSDPSIGYTVRYDENSIAVEFNQPLEEVIDVTISII